MFFCDICCTDTDGQPYARVIRGLLRMLMCQECFNAMLAVRGIPIKEGITGVTSFRGQDTEDDLSDE